MSELPRARRVLVVDDNEDIANTIAMLLGYEGHHTEVAYSSAQALERDDFAPEIALLDIGLPDIDGYQLAQMLRAKPWGKRLCLIAVTGWSTPAHRAAAEQAGFDHILVKPATVERLLALIQEWNPAS